MKSHVGIYRERCYKEYVKWIVTFNIKGWDQRKLNMQYYEKILIMSKNYKKNLNLYDTMMLCYYDKMIEYCVDTIQFTMLVIK